MEVDAHEQRLVVQHLLEVGDQPLAVDGVAGEAATDVVVHPARRHRVERGGDDGAGGLGPDDMNARSTSSRCIVDGNFGACPNPPHSASNEPTICLSAPLTASIAGDVTGGTDLGRRPDRLDERRDVRVDVVAPVAPDVVDGVHQLEEAGFREVGAAVERPAVGGHEHGHRPPAPAGHRLHRVHVDRVDVGPLLAVDLDVDERARSSPPRPRRPRSTRGPSRGTSGTPSTRPSSSTGTSRSRAASNASGPHAYQSTGLSRCWRRYGDVSSASRFIEPTLPTRSSGAS